MADHEADPRMQRSPLRRPGCVAALILWFIALLTPCFLIMLAVRGEITITTGSAPDQQLRIWLIQEADERGIGISSAGVQQDGEAVCVQTNVNFVLWRGKAQPTQYCECYIQTGDDYEMTQMTQTACSLP